MDTPLANLMERLALDLGMIPDHEDNAAIMREAAELVMAVDQVLDRAYQSQPGGLRTLSVLLVASYLSAASIAQAAVKAPDTDSRAQLFEAWARGSLTLAMDLHRVFLEAIRQGRLPDDRTDWNPGQGGGETNGHHG